MRHARNTVSPPLPHGYIGIAVRRDYVFKRATGKRVFKDHIGNLVYDCPIPTGHRRSNPTDRRTMGCRGNLIRGNIIMLHVMVFQEKV